MVDWERVRGLSMAVVITGALAYVIWCNLLCSSRKKRRDDEEEPQPSQLQDEAPREKRCKEESHVMGHKEKSCAKEESPNEEPRVKPSLKEEPPVNEPKEKPCAKEEPPKEETRVKPLVKEEPFVKPPVKEKPPVKSRIMEEPPVHEPKEKPCVQEEPPEEEEPPKAETLVKPLVKEEPCVKEEPPERQPIQPPLRAQPHLEEAPQLRVPQVSPTSEHPSQAKPSENKYILVLGLDGAGKSSILNSLSASRAKRCVTPTEGLNALCIATEDGKFEFLELGGSESLRSFWNIYLPQAHLLIFVVDSADHDRLPLAKKYLFKAIDINSTLPVMVLANKQDLDHAFNIAQIHEALSLSEIGDDRKLFLISTHVSPDDAELSSGLQDAKQLISQIVLNTDSEHATELANESVKSVYKAI